MKQAIAGLDKQLQNASFDVDGLDTLAWDLATARYEEIRDGRTAIDIASKTSEASEYKNAKHVDTLAAAYAEVGDFDTAVKWSEKAVELAPHDKRRVVHLNSFRAGMPWRAP